MQFGTLNEIQPGPEPWEPGSQKRLFEELLEQVVLTEELGFDYTWMTEHHFVPGWSLSSAPEVVFGWLAANTSRIRIGHGVVQANPPTNHVLRIAERAAVEDIISNGRVDIGLGRSLVSVELGAFDMDPKDTRPAQQEVIDILPRVWTEDPFSWDGKYYKIPEVRLQPRPIQDPHPPLWLAANQPASFQIAAERGLGVLAFGFGSAYALKQPIADYHVGVAGSALPSGAVNPRVAAAVPMFCADTDEEAFEAFGPHLETFFRYTAEFIAAFKDTTVDTYQFYRELSKRQVIELPELTTEESRGLSPAGAMAKAGAKGGFFCVGNPETCLEFVKGWQDAGLDQLILISQLGKVPHEDIMRSYRLFATEVMAKVNQPALDAVGAEG
jgi:alkanesulfonate monooxygenase SsuD/methylene tetrahydromethanopterin reductase-like flavin-dependent oxidoreductase (luciferase family)